MHVQLSELIIPDGTIFAFMSRDVGNSTAYFGIPANRVVELGSQIEL
jgi:KUP system potassium uptake protein